MQERFTLLSSIFDYVVQANGSCCTSTVKPQPFMLPSVSPGVSNDEVKGSPIELVNLSKLFIIAFELAMKPMSICVGDSLGSLLS